MATKKVYAGLTVALATSLGANVYLAGNVELKAAIPTQHTATITGTATPQQKTGAEAVVLSVLGAPAVAEFGEGVVSLADAKERGVCLTWHDVDTPEERMDLACAITKTGEWTAGQ